MTFPVFVLAKNEGPNIERCVAPLREAGLAVTVLDSGSSDDTRERAERLGASVEPYAYLDHLTAYRHVCLERIPRGKLGMILDADMVVRPDLLEELRTLAERDDLDAILAPVEMWWCGVPLTHGSLYPPKPIVFRGGRHAFMADGHGERLLHGLNLARTHARLIHDDRKPYQAFLGAQFRYSNQLLQRKQTGRLRWRNRIRLTGPLGLMLGPVMTYVCRGGFLAGRVGLIYALDRVIAEAIMFRQALASKIAPPPESPAPLRRP